MSYDAKCDELARYFLADDYSKDRRYEQWVKEIAELVQSTVEDYMENVEFHEEQP